MDKMVDVKEIFDNEVLNIENLREVHNLSTIRLEYNTIVFCKAGRIIVEVGGNSQVKVLPGQLLLIPTGKLVQPMFFSTDVDASALLVSDRLLKSVLNNQINIWNKAMYMKEIYIVENAGWLESVRAYTRAIFKEVAQPFLMREIFYSFLRTMLLLICAELLSHVEMQQTNDESSVHDKELFNRFLQLLSTEEQKRRKVSYYAEKLNISSKYLSIITKRVSGKCPLRWITNSVMEDCFRLLKTTDLSIKEISNKMGFPNPSFFGQYFREQTGKTPMAYRAECKNIV